MTIFPILFTALSSIPATMFVVTEINKIQMTMLNLIKM